jgi:CHAD domain-containing protein
MSSHPNPHPFRKPTSQRRGGKLRLPRGTPLREGMIVAFTRILGVARRSARAAESDPVGAVHEYRKSIRRARALVSLLRPALGKTTASGLRGELRRAFGDTGPLRDADILLASLRSIAADASERGPIEAALESERANRPGAEETADLLRRGARILSPLPSALRVTMPATFSMADLERGLARSDRRTRRALRSATASGDMADFHEWRKRVKELRYQVELLASTGSRELKKREKALGSLAQDLGDVTDLIVLRAEIDRRRREGRLAAAPGLDERLDATIRERSGELLRRGAELLAEAPAVFARQVLADRG